MIDLLESSTSPNINCLEGKRCPNCGSYGPLEIATIVLVLVYDNGVHDTVGGNVEYDGEARTVCHLCRHEGKLSDFDE